jgi:hypothetical protein
MSDARQADHEMFGCTTLPNGVKLLHPQSAEAQALYAEWAASNARSEKALAEHRTARAAAEERANQARNEEIRRRNERDAAKQGYEFEATLRQKGGLWVHDPTIKGRRSKRFPVGVTEADAGKVLRFRSLPFSLEVIR